MKNGKDYMLAVVGDIHLSKRTWTKKQDIYDDAAISLKWITKTCIDKKYDVLFLGDQFDTNYPPVEMVQIWYECVDKIIKSGLKVYTIDGNHDPGQQPTDNSVARSWTKVHPEVIHVDMKCFKYGDIVMCGYDYRPLSQISLVKDHIEQNKPDIIFIHQFPKEYGFEIDGIWDIDLSDINHTGYSVFCGHIHDHKVVDLKSGGKLYVVGSTNPRSITEICPKVFYTIDNNANIKCHDLPARKIYKFDFISGDEEELLANLETTVNTLHKVDYDFQLPISKPIVVSTYDGDNSSLFAKIESICLNKAHTFYQPKFNNVKMVSDEVKSKSITLSSLISDTIEDEELSSLGLRLLSSPEDIDDHVDFYLSTLAIEEEPNASSKQTSS